MHPFDDAVALAPSGDGRWTGRTTAAYANMVGPFGGITAATLLQAVLQHPERHGDPAAMTVNFAGPVADGEFEIVTRAVRTNRSTQHWVVDLVQDGTRTTASVVLATRRRTWSDTELARPDVPGADSVAPTADQAPLPWMRQYDMRYVAGPLPDAEHAVPAAPDSTTRLWVRDRPARALDFPALAAMCDVFYPRVFLRLGEWMPAGTVTFTVYFHATDDDLHRVGTEFVLAQARGQRYGSGFFDQSALLWAADGQLLASSNQLVYFKHAEQQRVAPAG